MRFLLPEVIEAGITLKDAKKFITPAPKYMVANANSKLSPVKMVIAPHRPYMTTEQSINYAWTIKPSEDNPQVQTSSILSLS